MALLKFIRHLMFGDNKGGVRRCHVLTVQCKNMRGNNIGVRKLCAFSAQNFNEHDNRGIEKRGGTEVFNGLSEDFCSLVFTAETFFFNYNSTALFNRCLLNFFII